MGILFPRREEIATAGFDPFRQLDPDAFNAPASTGLLMPALPVTYLALLAVADLAAGDSVIGLRQYLDLLTIIASGEESPSAPYYPLPQPVISPGFRFIDGGTTWILTRQPKREPSRLRGPVDMDSFIFRDSDGSAVVYETATVNPAPPIFAGTYLAVSAYTPPAVQGTKVLAVRDIRWPWGTQSNDRLQFRCEAPERWRFYCMLTQTNPETRNTPSIDPSNGYVLPPEQGFIQNYASTARYGWVAGAMIIQRGKKGCAP